MILRTKERGAVLNHHLTQKLLYDLLAKLEQLSTRLPINMDAGCRRYPRCQE